MATEIDAGAVNGVLPSEVMTAAATSVTVLPIRESPNGQQRVEDFEVVVDTRMGLPWRPGFRDRG